MRRSALAAAHAGVAALLSCGAVDAQVNSYATVTSEYVTRGLAASDGAAALQLAVDYQHDSGFFTGAWATNIDIDNAAGGRRSLELDLYAGVHRDLGARWAGALTVIRYTYPGASSGAYNSVSPTVSGDRRFDYTEWLLGAQWADRVSIEVGYSPGVYGTRQAGRHVQAGVTHALASGWVLSGSLGRNDLSALRVPAYLYWDLGASATWSRFTLDLRWYDNERVYSGGYGGYAAGSRWVGSLSVAF
jgi:uncharacterized protein (TIGR02001 family)